MVDNGLLKYYKEKAHREGYLLEGLIPFMPISKSLDRVRLCTLDVGRYYIKTPRRAGINTRCSVDPEVLLSQIYAKAGLHTAIYLPIQSINGRGVISNDISYATGEKIINAEKYLDSKMDSSKRFFTNYLDPTSHGGDASHLTLNAQKQQAKMRILDVASFNTDRHERNFFYKLVPALENGQTLFSGATPLEETSHQCVETGAQNGETGKEFIADDVATFDYELSGFIAYLKNSSDPRLTSEIENYEWYRNDFHYSILSRSSMLNQIKCNPLLEELVDKQSLAEEIGSLDPVGVAQDITETTGYEFDPKYPELLAQSYNEVAEALIQ